MAKMPSSTIQVLRTSRSENPNCAWCLEKNLHGTELCRIMQFDPGSSGLMRVFQPVAMLSEAHTYTLKNSSRVHWRQSSCTLYLVFIMAFRTFRFISLSSAKTGTPACTHQISSGVDTSQSRLTWTQSPSLSRPSSFGR